MTLHSPNETEGLHRKGLVKEMGRGKDRTNFWFTSLTKQFKKRTLTAKCLFWPVKTMRHRSLFFSSNFMTRESELYKTDPIHHSKHGEFLSRGDWWLLPLQLWMNISAAPAGKARFLWHTPVDVTRWALQAKPCKLEPYSNTNANTVLY